MDYAYDDANRLTRLDYSGLAAGPQSLTYSYDGASNRIATGGSWARTLLPDPVASASYDAANRQQTFGTKTMTYDNNGNLETLTDGGQTTTYAWDVRDLLASVTGPAVTAAFAYDATGRRIQKTVGGFATTLQYDGSDIVREVAGGPEVNFLRGLGVDETLARIETGGTSCYLDDALGSTVALADSGGGVPTEYTYEPFGRTTSAGAPSQNSFQFTGRENDGTGLYYFRARYYEPRLSRFIQEDPIGPAGGLNAFAYVEGNPLSKTDRFGLKPDHEECCRRLRQLGGEPRPGQVLLGRAGCCNGHTACVYNPPPGELANDIIRLCVVAHEMGHFFEFPCPRCGVTEGRIPAYLENASECLARGEELECLFRSLYMCQGNRACIFALLQWIARRRAERAGYCRGANWGAN